MMWRIVPLALAVQVALGLRPVLQKSDRMPAVVRKALRPWQERPSRAAVRLDREFMIDTSVVLGPSPGYDGEPDAATDGSRWLVVWNGGDGQTIAAARFTDGGALIDTLPIRISPGGTPGVAPRVAFNGTDFFVTWADQSSSWLVAARVTTTGVVRDSAPILLGEGWGPAPVAAVGETCLVAWSAYGGGSSDIFAARVLASGTVLDPGGFPVAEDEVEEFAPELAASGNGFLVVWNQVAYDTARGESDVCAARVSIAGQVLDTVPIPVAAKQGWSETYPAVGFGSDEYLVTWIKDTTYDFVPTVECRRLTADGAIIDTAVIRLPPAGGWSERPHVAAEGGAFLVKCEAMDTLSWIRSVYGCRVSSAGVVLDSVPFLISDRDREASMARVCDGPGRFLAVWSQYGGMSADIHAARISAQGAVLDTPSVLLTLGADMQYLPRATACSTGALVAWLETRETGSILQAGRVSHDGRPLDPCGIDVAAGPCFEMPPGVCRGNGTCLLVWTSLRPDAAGLYAARLTDAGILLDTNGIAICTTITLPIAPSIAFSGESFLVTWSDIDTVSWTSRILGSRVTPEGAVLDPEPIVIADEDMTAMLSCAVFNGGNYIVAWSGSDGDELDLKFRRLRPDGVLLDTTARVLSSAESDQLWLSGAVGDETTLLVWMDYRSQIDGDVYAARVLRDGTVLDPEGLLISEEGVDDHLPGVVWTGNDYQAFWIRNDFDSVAVAGVRLGPNGTVLERFTAAAGVTSTVSPVALSSGNVLVAWDGFAAEYLGRPYNCTRAWAKLGPFTAVAEPELPRARSAPVPTVVRGVLRLPGSPTAVRYALFDLSGRQVRRLNPGLNDVRSLSPGIYFVRRLGDRQPARKVIVTK